MLPLYELSAGRYMRIACPRRTGIVVCKAAPDQGVGAKAAVALALRALGDAQPAREKPIDSGHQRVAGVELEGQRA